MAESNIALKFTTKVQTDGTIMIATCVNDLSARWTILRAEMERKYS